MSSTRATPPPGLRPVRVRHQARDALALMVFSAGLSLSLAISLLVVASLGH